MWNERYAETEFAYGTEPNDFLRAHAPRFLKSPVLSLAEGQGRNAVYLASIGLEVTGVDQSAVGLHRAFNLAAERGVSINTIVADLADYTPPDDYFNGVVSIFAHLPSPIRRSLHERVIHAMRPGGVFLLEAYTPDQIKYGTGGPKDPDLCMTLESLSEELSGCDIEFGQEIVREVVEGRYHTGNAAVVQIIARKKS